MATSLKGKTLFITGASRGIGKAIALRAAEDGANVVIAAKTAEAHPKLPGTIYTAKAEIEAAGGKALACIVDVRFEEQIADAVKLAVETFGGIDILVNNASAISLTGTLETPMKRFDLMHGINTRGTFACSQACIPHLAKAENPHILNLSPPLNMEPRWFGPPFSPSDARGVGSSWSRTQAVDSDGPPVRPGASVPWSSVVGVGSSRPPVSISPWSTITCKLVT